MELRKAKREDVSAILSIIKEAQVALKEAGINQWQNNYPNQMSIEKDIQESIAYVLVKNQRVIGTVAFLTTDDPNYLNPVSGKWLTTTPYACIHRIALAKDVKGSEASGYLMNQLKQLAKENNLPSIRVDTHADNKRMQNYLMKHGFERIGVIALQDGALRDAFECIIC